MAPRDYEENSGIDNVSGSDDEMQSQSPSEATSDAATLADKFDEDTFHQLLLKFIILGDQSLNLVEAPTFRRLILYLRHDTMIPDQTMMHDLVMQAWQKYFMVLKGDLENAIGRISFTIDTWSDQIRQPYLAITAHWIARIEKTTSLQLKSSLIAFNRLPDYYDGETLANTVLEALDRAEITAKVGHITLGNNNLNIMMESLERMLDAREIAFDAADRKIMCLGRVVDLSSARVIHAVASTAGKTDGASASNSIALARAAVQAIRESGPRRDAFDQVIANGNAKGWFKQGEPPETVQLKSLQLLLDVTTHWDSAFYMLNRLRDMRPVVDYLLANNSDLAKYQISSHDWLAMQDVEIILCMSHIVQQVMSDKSTPILSGAIPEFEMMIKCWEKLVEIYPRLERLVQPGLNCAYTYYVPMNRTRAYFVAMVLNPAMRMTWINKHWDQEHVTIAETKILQTMREYREKAASNSDSEEADLDTRRIPKDMSLAEQYGIKFDLMYTSESSAKKQTIEEEYQAYITAPLSSKDVDILKFWEVYGASFPTLFAMAMDYLPIQAIAIPCKRIFSSSARIDNQISPILMEARQMVKFDMKPEWLNFTKAWMTPEKEMVEDDEDDEYSDDSDED